MANAAFTVLLDGADNALRVDPINAWRLALHPDGLARRIVDLAERGRHVTDGLRAYQRGQPTPELGDLIGELEGLPAPRPPRRTPDTSGSRCRFGCGYRTAS